MIRYQEFAPGPSSDRLVVCYWILKGFSNGFHEVLPDGSMDIIFNFSTPLVNRSKDKDQINKATSFVVGNLTRSMLSGCRNDYDLLGIRFRAGGLYALLKQPLNAFTDLSVALEYTNADLKSDLAEQLYPLNTSERITWLERWLGVVKAETDARIHQALMIVEKTRGVIPVATLADKVCLSPKQLQRLFLEQIGITPKVYADTIRFQELQKVMDQPVPRWEMAETLGFYDHSHLHRFFHRFTSRKLAG